MTPAFKQVASNHFSLSGELNMQTVPPVAREAGDIFNSLSGEVHVDLSEVTRADSAGLALLIDWLRVAKRRNFTLTFHHLPEQLLQIARVSELDKILPVQG